MNDYYIGVDQNGQPYISHANSLQTAAASVRSAGAGLGRGVRRYHKYLMKIGEGAKARYLYTQQEVQAYMRGGRKALDQMAKNTKENARNGLTAASDKVKTTGKNVKNKASDAVEYAKDNSKQLLNVRDDYIDAKRTHKGTKSSNPVTARLERKRYAEDNTLGGKVYKTQQAIKEKIGNDARKDVLEKKADLERAKKLTKGSREALGSEDLLTKGFSRMVREREKQLNAAERKYDRTLLGKAEGAADKAKETGKSAISNVKSTSDRMKEEFRKKKDEVKNDAHNKLNNAAWKAAKGLEGADVRKQFENAADEFIKNPTPENKKKRDELYDKWAETPHGKFINNEFIAGVQQNGLKDTVKDAVDEGKGRVKDSVKSTSDRMKEEFRKKKDEVSKAAKSKEQAFNDALEEYRKNPNYENTEKLNDAKDAYKSTPKGAIDKRTKDKYFREASDEEMRGNKAQYSEYRKDDPDFDENNYSENDRVGDTDFFAFKGADGRTVIIEEDMKWTLPKGVEPDDPAIKEAISKFGDEVSSARSLNMGNYTGDQWTKGATDAINDAIEKAQKRNKKS